MSARGARASIDTRMSVKPAPRQVPDPDVPAVDDNSPPTEHAGKRKFTFPTAFTVLAIVLLLVWIASFFVPPGVYNADASGSPVPGTYHKLPECSAVAAGGPALARDRSSTKCARRSGSTRSRW